MSDSVSRRVGKIGISAEAWRRITVRYPNFGITFSLFIILIAMSLVIGLINPRFFMARNLMNILIQVSGYTCLAVGMTLVMTTGGLDISVGATVGMVTAVMGVAMSWWELGGVQTIFLGILVGLIAGFINGLFVVVFNVPSLIVTLGTRAAYRNLGYIFTEGELLFGFPDSFRWVARSRIIGIPFPVLLAGLVAAWGIYFLYKTKTGRHITAIGGNREAARLSGIKVRQTTWLVFIISGFTAALAALIAVSRLDAAQPSTGVDYEIHTIAAVVLGGTLLTGGRGLMVGSVLAMIILQVMANGMVLMGVSFFWQQVVIGVVFILVVAVRTLRSREIQKIGL